MNVVIDGIEYVRGPAAVSPEAHKLLNDIYATLWCEAYYDPTYGEVTQNFAKPLADKMRQLNTLLGFKA
jgi:hypothetical protein